MAQDVFRQWLDAQKEWMSKWNTEKEENQWTKAYEGWLNTQEKAWEQWKEMTEKAASGQQNPFMPNFSNPMQSFMDFEKMQKETMEAWQNMAKANPAAQYFQQLPNMDAYMKQMSEFSNPLKGFHPFDKDAARTMRRIMDANRMYMTFYNNFEELRQNVLKPGTKEVEKLWDQMVEQGKMNYHSLVEPFIPEQVRAYMDAPAQFMSGYQEHMQGFFAPWKEAADELSDLYTQSLSGDTKKLTEFYQLWREKYDETFGAYLRSPMMGNSGEDMEIQSEFFDQVIRLSIVSAEFSQKIFQVTQKHVRERLNDYMELVEKEEGPKTFKEFYKYWSSLIEKQLNEYFYSNEFAELLGEFSEAFAKTRIVQNRLIEQNLKKTPIVVESDVRSLYKKVQELKREVKSLKKEMELLKAKPEPKKTTTTTRKTAAKPQETK